jgi:hypothetical protein
MPYSFKQLVRKRNEFNTDQVRLSNTAMTKLVAVPASNPGLHAVPDSIRLRAHNENDCHCERPQNIGEQLIKRIIHPLPIIGADDG